MANRKKGSGIYLRTKPAWNKGKVGFMKGRKFSEEHKEKIRLALTGNKNGLKEIKQTIEEKKIFAKAYRLKTKLDVLIHYSFGMLQCACCGSDDFDSLTIDHIEGGGNRHRNLIFNGNVCSGSPFHLWLRENGYPYGYQVLCKRCNCSKGITNKCRLIHD